MEIFDVRQRRLRELMRRDYSGKQKLLAAAIERDPNYVSRLLSNGKHRKNLAEELAREIETKLKLAPGWLDRETDADDPRLAYHGVLLTRAGALLGAEWEKMDVADRIEIQQDIERRVKRRKLEDRQRNRPADPV